jgi:hypothetical protein
VHHLVDDALRHPDLLGDRGDGVAAGQALRLGALDAGEQLGRVVDRCRRLRTRDDDRHLSTDALGGPAHERTETVATDLLVRLRQLPADRCRTVGTDSPVAVRESVARATSQRIRLP